MSMRPDRHHRFLLARKRGGALEIVFPPIEAVVASRPAGFDPNDEEAEQGHAKPAHMAAAVRKSRLIAMARGVPPPPIPAGSSGSSSGEGSGGGAGRAGGKRKRGAAGSPPPSNEPRFTAKKRTYSFKRERKGGGKARRWKTLRQVLTGEKYQLLPVNVPTYSNIAAAPSMLPAKKYSDISGLPAKYTDPQTKLRYASADEYKTIRLLPDEAVSGLLAVRRALQKLK